MRTRQVSANQACVRSSFQEDDRSSIDVSDAAVPVQNVTRQLSVDAVSLPPFTQELIARGGLVRWPGLFSSADGKS